MFRKKDTAKRKLEAILSLSSDDEVDSSDDDTSDDPDYFERLDPKNKKFRSASGDHFPKARSLTHLMGAGMGKITTDQTYFVQTTLTTPEKPKKALPIPLRTPEKAVLSTPQKGAHSSQLISPGGSSYDNQGKITVVKTKDDKTSVTTHYSLFFRSTSSSKDNRINFPATPPDKFAKLKSHIDELHNSHAKISLPPVLSVTLERISDIHDEGKKRRPDNKSVMGHSAKDAATLGGFNIPSDVVLQWLHVKAAYIAGQFDENIKRSRSQVATNLILGTREGNAHMTLIEMAFKKILLNKKLNIDEIHQSETIEWVPGYENVIANVIHYKLSIPGCEITYDLDPWTLNKVPDNKEELINEFVEIVFSETAKESKQKIKPAAEETAPLPFKLSLFTLFQERGSEASPKPVTTANTNLDSGSNVPDSTTSEPLPTIKIKLEPSK